MRRIKMQVPPTLEQLQKELRRETYRRNYGKALRGTVYSLIIVAAIAVLVATLLLPVLQIYGTSMAPSLDDGDIVVSLKGANFNRGDIVAFYYNNKILIKRVIALPGEWIDIDEQGTVWIDGVLFEEPYLAEKAKGECDIELPFQVPEARLFLMGDHRTVSVDSRSTSVGCVAEEQIVGKIVYRIWPLSMFGGIPGVFRRDG